MAEALAKVFHAQKAKHKTGVYQAKSVELSNELIEKTRNAGLTISDINFEAWLKDDNAAVVLSYGSTEEDKELRLMAAKYRLLAFSEEETYQAYLQSLTSLDFDVTPLQDWLKKEGVSHL
jgi:carbamoyl-phosphate synthase large subunit